MTWHITVKQPKPVSGHIIKEKTGIDINGNIVSPGSYRVKRGSVITVYAVAVITGGSPGSYDTFKLRWYDEISNKVICETIEKHHSGEYIRLGKDIRVSGNMKLVVELYRFDEKTEEWMLLDKYGC